MEWIGELVNKILGWLLGLWGWILDKAWNIIVDIIQSVIDTIAGAILYLLSFLPATPQWLLDLATPPDWVVEYASMINVIIPIPTMIYCIGAILTVYLWMLAVAPVKKFIGMLGAS